jgi:hypothetical protein
VTDRAVSTVLDVSVSLLLVGAAMLTLLSAPTAGPDPAAGRAEEVATTLAGSTATVSYEAAGETRAAHGTMAGLLADAAVSNRTPGDGAAFRAAVASATRSSLGGTGWRGEIIATWRPYEGADDAARMRVGRTPPVGVSVHAATMEIPSGLPPVRRAAERAAERGGYEGVAAVVSAALGGAAGEADGGSSGGERQRAIEADLERRFESPAAAAAAVRIGRVHITVRTWSP